MNPLEPTSMGWAWRRTRLSGPVLDAPGMFKGNRTGEEDDTMEREDKAPHETNSGFRERAIQERIDVILGEHLQETEEYYQAGDRIMEGLDQETARKFEEFVSEYVTISGKEYRMIYLGGLADGLRLGAMAFGGWVPEDE